MHISEGYLSAPVLASGAVLAVAGTAVGLKSLDYERVAQAGILASAFFVASLVHVPIGPSSAHLIMNGIIGLLLGWGAFPVIAVALLLQAVFFQYGGITTLGVNTVVMAAPAVTVYYLFGRHIGAQGWSGKISAFFGGAGAIMLSTVLMAAALVFSDEKFFIVAGSALLIHLPIMVIEGLVTAFCIGFLIKVKPELLPDRRNGREKNDGYHSETG